MSLLQSIQQTIRYADYFKFPLSASEVHHWLISDIRYPKRDVLKLYNTELTPKESNKRYLLQANSNSKLDEANHIAKILSLLPTIKLVAVTGSVAIGNAKDIDDIDLMIITSPDTLWLTRPLVYVLLRLLFKRRKPFSKEKTSHPDTSNVVCDNLWLDTTSLSVILAKRNLYTAHEILQLKPVFDRDTVYKNFLQENSWVKDYLANAYAQTLKNASPNNYIESRNSPSLLKMLNKYAFKVQYAHMKSKMTKEFISEHSAYFHPRDLSPTLNQYINNP